MKVEQIKGIVDGVYKIISGDSIDHFVKVICTVEDFKGVISNSRTIKVTTADVEFYVDTLGKNRIFVDPDKKIYVEALLITFKYGDLKKGIKL